MYVNFVSDRMLLESDMNWKGYQAEIAKAEERSISLLRMSIAPI